MEATCQDFPKVQSVPRQASHARIRRFAGSSAPRLYSFDLSSSTSQGCWAVSAIDSRAARGLCCFLFWRGEPGGQHHVEWSHCPKPTCERDEMLCEEHRRIVSGEADRPATKWADRMKRNQSSKSKRRKRRHDDTQRSLCRFSDRRAQP